MSDLSDADLSVEEGTVDEIPSLNVQRLKIRETFQVNNVSGLKQKLNDLQLNLDWIESLDITLDPPEEDDEQNSKDFTKAENDFKREMSFYNQALASVSKAFKRLKKLGIPTKRPDDYFAEMAKSDSHMVKVREKLLSKQAVIERIEKIRSIREQKKHGKEVQREILQKRKQEKQKMIKAIKKTKKGKMGADQLLEEKKPMTSNKPASNKPSATNRNKNKFKRDFKDSRYGYGGKKRGSKYNDAKSSSFDSGMQNKEGKGQRKSFGNKKPNFGKKRAGKNRRRR